jgi:hypothetical protein
VSDWPSLDDRPSGILVRRRRFGVDKFVALTAVISIGAGAGVAAWTMLRDRDRDDDDGGEPASAETAAATTSGGDDTTSGDDPSATPDLGGPRLDLGGPLRLDMPEAWWDDPSQAPSELPGPDVEVPDWED